MELFDVAKVEACIAGFMEAAQRAGANRLEMLQAAKSVSHAVCSAMGEAAREYERELEGEME